METKNYPNYYKRSNKVSSRQEKVREINYTITFPKIYCLGHMGRHIIFTKKIYNNNKAVVVVWARAIDVFKDELFARVQQGLFPGR